MNTKICIGIPCNRAIRPKTVLSLLEMVAFSDYSYYFVIATEGYTISENRNYIATHAINNGCTHLLFIDDDMVFPPDTLERLLNHQKEIVGVVYHSRKFPPEPTVVLENGSVLKSENIPKEPMKCQHVGTGIMLIDLNVFKKIDRPWFTTETHETGWTLVGEDAFFCTQARNKGIEVWCDPTLDIKHIGDFLY